MSIRTTGCISISTPQELEEAIGTCARHSGSLNCPINGSVTIERDQDGTLSCLFIVKWALSKQLHFKQFSEATKNAKHLTSLERARLQMGDIRRGR